MTFYFIFWSQLVFTKVNRQEENLGAYNFFREISKMCLKELICYKRSDEEWIGGVVYVFFGIQSFYSIYVSSTDVYMILHYRRHLALRCLFGLYILSLVECFKLTLTACLFIYVFMCHPLNCPPYIKVAFWQSLNLMFTPFEVRVRTYFINLYLLPSWLGL